VLLVPQRVFLRHTALGNAVKQCCVTSASLQFTHTHTHIQAHPTPHAQVVVLCLRVIVPATIHHD